MFAYFEETKCVHVPLTRAYSCKGRPAAEDTTKDSETGGTERTAH